MPNVKNTEITSAREVNHLKDTTTICIFTKLQPKVVIYAFCHVWDLWRWLPDTVTSSKKISPNFNFTIPGLQENFWSWKICLLKSVDHELQNDVSHDLVMIMTSKMTFLTNKMGVLTELPIKWLNHVKSNIFRISVTNASIWGTTSAYSVNTPKNFHNSRMLKNVYGLITWLMNG